MVCLIKIFFLQQQLEDQAAKPPVEEKPGTPDVPSEPKNQSIAQLIYAENRVRIIKPYTRPSLQNSKNL